MNQPLKIKLIKHTTNILEKLGVAGMAVGLFQGKSFGVIVGIVLIATSSGFVLWEERS